MDSTSADMSSSPSLHLDALLLGADHPRYHIVKPCRPCSHSGSSIPTRHSSAERLQNGSGLFRRPSQAGLFVNHDLRSGDDCALLNNNRCRIWVSLSQAERAGAQDWKERRVPVQVRAPPRTKARRLGFVAAPGQVEARFCKIELSQRSGQSMRYWRSFAFW